MTPEQAINYLTLNKPSSGYPGLCEAIDMAIAALRDRPAPPDALVAKLNVRHDEALHTAIGWMSQEENLVTTREALIELLMMLKPVIFAAPAPVAAPVSDVRIVALLDSLSSEQARQAGSLASVAAPAPETPAPVDVPACPDGQHSYRRNAPPQNGDVCFVCRKSIWWETPAPDAMPEKRGHQIVARDRDGMPWCETCRKWGVREDGPCDRTYPGSTGRRQEAQP